MTSSKRRPENRWEFIQGDDASWHWRFLDNVLTPAAVTLSREHFPRLDDCVANAKRHGYAGRPILWQALWGGIFFYSPMDGRGRVTTVRSASRK